VASSVGASRPGSSTIVADPPPLAQHAVGPGVPPPGSGVATRPGSLPAAPTNQSASTPSALVPPRPSTRSQHGIVQPKRRTDGTVRWCNLTTTEEPSSVDDALQDKH
jgi:hypothetical protein